MKLSATVVATTTFAAGADGELEDVLMGADLLSTTYTIIEEDVDSETGELARQIVEKLRGAGYKAWLVGGCVRDRLLDRKPEDYDVATDALPAQVAALFEGSCPKGPDYGVVSVRRGEAEVEVVTLRSDHRYQDGRRPLSVTFVDDPRLDVQRRDFTVNGLLMDPETGEILDFVGGRADLEARLIRTIGEPDRRFTEDYLRMLRAIRLAAVLNFRIEPRTFESIRRHCRLVSKVSPDRIRIELVRTLTERGARRGMELMDESGLLAEILPEVARMKGVPQPPEFHPEGDVWTHTLLMLDLLDRREKKPTATLALGVLLHDVGKPATYRVADRIRFDEHDVVGAQIAADILRRLRFSNDEIRQVGALVRYHLRWRHVRQMRESKLKRFMALDRFDEHLELHRLDCLASHGGLDNYEFVRRKLAETPPEELKPKRLISGRDLIQMGFRPGPAFSVILAEVEDAQLESRLTTPEQAREFVLARFEPPEGRRRQEVA
ncbi:MAG: CCA tRNA nucleotidyltransferase [Bryobacterales bacterium]|nr:CCA tRNA nucleotidyltransferase [Bryobacteraceae bacterium]MDW8129145.1 CCA tRNA nucleotidyltransferase [Bryobacterales bacterium]